jgi:outer membrane protein OmpA-like peptidoglycan-associated protein
VPVVDPADTEEKKQMQRLSFFIMVCAALLVVSGCASKKYVRNQVQTSSDTLTARIETNEGQIKEVQDEADKKVAGVDSKVSALDAKTSEQLGSVKTDVQNVDQKTSQANSTAERAAAGVFTLDSKFQNRNNFNTADQKSVQFKFNSAALDPQYKDLLDEIANALMQNPDAIVVLEGRTDSTGSKDYNVRLGERRIEAVRRYLAVEKGVPVYRIHNISFGAEKPIAENNTRDGREKNRVVTMTVLVPKTEGAVASRN